MSKRLILPALLALASVVAPAAQAAPAKKKASQKTAKVITKKSGLKIQDLRVGKGPAAKAGQTVTVHYRGTFTNGKVFDQSYGRGPFPFALGGGQVIKGWDEGVAGMRVGGKRKLTIPYQLAYGAAGMPPTIPPKSTLVFQVELLQIG